MDTFDARNFTPSQGGEAHPLGMYDFTISNTYAKGTKDNTGGMLVIEFTSPVGRIEKRYNLWNSSPQAVEIAQKELSALCYATNVFKLSFPKNPDGSPIVDKAAFELRGARGRMEVVPQKRKNSSGQLEDTGYVEIKKVYDAQGNEPGKAPQAAQPIQPAQQSNGQAQPNAGWTNQQPQAQPQNNQPSQQPMQQNNAGGWGQPAPQQQQPQPNQPQGGSPPWGSQ